MKEWKGAREKEIERGRGGKRKEEGGRNGGGKRQREGDKDIAKPLYRSDT